MFPCQWHFVDFEAAFWRTLSSKWVEDQAQKKIDADHCSRKWNLNLLIILTIKWEENLAEVEAIHKYYGYL